MMVDAAGLLEGARFVPSPNCDDRPRDTPVDLLVIHSISLPPGEFGGGAVEALFTNCLDPLGHPFFAEIASMRVSAHLFLRRDGEIIQFVPFHRRAWHAGVSRWAGRERCNDFSIGVELEGSDEQPFTERQYHRLVSAVTALQAAFPLVAVAGHADIAPGRKTDPGPHFDWSRLQVTGLPRHP